MTGAEIVLDWIKRYREENGIIPFASEIESQLEMAVKGEEQSRKADVSGEVPSDEQIEAEARRLYPNRDIHRHAFKKGVKWVTGNDR